MDDLFGIWGEMWQVLQDKLDEIHAEHPQNLVTSMRRAIFFNKRRG